MVKQKEQLGDSVALMARPDVAGPDALRDLLWGFHGVPEIQRFERLLHSLTIKVRMNEDDEIR